MAGSFGDLLKKAGFEGSPEADKPAETQDAAVAPEEMAYAPKMVVRRSRKGRGGKTVTLVEGITAGATQVLGRLKKELGCGGRVEDGVVVLQGDNRERVARWLESQGVKKVVRS